MLLLYDFQALADDQVKASDRSLVSIEQAFDIDYSKGIVNQPTLQSAIEIGVCSHRGPSVDLDEPRLEVDINHEIVSVEFEWIFAGKDALLHRLQRTQDDVFDLGEAPIHPWGVVSREEIVLELIDQPLPASSLVVIFAVLLDLDVGKMGFLIRWALQRLSMF